MAPVDLPYLKIYAVGGKQYAYYRRAGRRVRVHAAPGSDGFAAAYEAARAAWETCKPDGNYAASMHELAPGTLAALVAAFKASPEFQELASKTRRTYASYLDELATRFGPAPVKDCHRAWVFRMRDEAQAKPRMANYKVAIIRRVMSFAVDRGLRQDNPALRVGALKTGGSYRTWTQAEIAAMTSPAAGDVALPVLIARWTALRRGDVLRLTWAALDGAWLRLTARKTRRAIGVPLTPALRSALETETRRALVICTTTTGRPWSDHHFAHRFMEVRAALGLPADLHFHGLRHTRLTELAEAGATEAELMATAGHLTPAMSARYTKTAGQEKLAQAAVVKLGKRRKISRSV